MQAEILNYKDVQLIIRRQCFQLTLPRVSFVTKKLKNKQKCEKLVQKQEH